MVRVIGGRVWKRTPSHIYTQSPFTCPSKTSKTLDMLVTVFFFLKAELNSNYDQQVSSSLLRKTTKRALFLS